MKGKYLFFIFAVWSLLGIDSSQARSFRVNQIPNGSKFSCNTCHVTPGGPRNPFGQAVEAGFLDANGNVTWNNTLAMMDSDGDGVANGVELQDPNGMWVIGQAQPGDINAVTNPGDPASKPTTAVADLLIPERFELLQNYPNPFNPETRITFRIPDAAVVRLEIYNPLGQRVRTLVAGRLTPGEHTFLWDGRNDLGETAPSGVYYYRISSGSQSAMRQMVLMR